MGQGAFDLPLRTFPCPHVGTQPRPCERFPGGAQDPFLSSVTCESDQNTLSSCWRRPRPPDHELLSSPCFRHPAPGGGGGSSGRCARAYGRRGAEGGPVGLLGGGLPALPTRRSISVEFLRNPSIWSQTCVCRLLWGRRAPPRRGEPPRTRLGCGSAHGRHISGVTLGAPSTAGSPHQCVTSPSHAL